MAKRNESLLAPFGIFPFDEPFFGIFSPRMVDLGRSGKMADEWSPRMRADVRETDDGYIVEADFPGADKKDIELSFDEDVLTISYEKSEDVGEEPKDEPEGEADGSEATELDKPRCNYIVKERHSRISLKRSFKLPEADIEKASAKFDNGVLTVTIGKKEQASKKTTLAID